MKITRKNDKWHIDFAHEDKRVVISGQMSEIVARLRTEFKTDEYLGEEKEAFDYRLKKLVSEAYRKYKLGIKRN